MPKRRKKLTQKQRGRGEILGKVSTLVPVLDFLLKLLELILKFFKII